MVVWGMRKSYVRTCLPNAQYRDTTDISDMLQAILWKFAGSQDPGDGQVICCACINEKQQLKQSTLTGCPWQYQHY